MPIAVIIANLLISLLFFSCSKSATSPPKGQVRIYLQDTAGQFDSVFVNISRISIHWAQAADSTTGWDILMTTPTTYDVASLRNGNRHQLFTRTLEPGTYDMLKVWFGHCLAKRNDTLFSLDFAPDSSHNYGVDSTNVTIRANDVTNTILDIDLFRSIYFDPDSARYFFIPHFRFIELDSTGSVYGWLNAPGYMFLMDDLDSLAFTESESGGNYFGFFGLPEGFYDIWIWPFDTLTYEPLTVEDLAITPPSNINLDTLIFPLRRGR